MDRGVRSHEHVIDYGRLANPRVLIVCTRCRRILSIVAFLSSALEILLRGSSRIMFPPASASTRLHGTHKQEAPGKIRVQTEKHLATMMVSLVLLASDVIPNSPRR